MIELTKLNGGKLVVNSDLIEFIEVLPDSLITLTTGKKIMVREKIPDIIAAIVDFRRRIRADRIIPQRQDVDVIEPANAGEVQGDDPSKGDSA